MNWTKIELDKEAIVKELRKQDQQLRDIFARREELSEITKENGCFDEVWEMLFEDGESHYSF